MLLVLLVAAVVSGARAQDTSCRDDPTGIVASTGNACSFVVAFGCDYDLGALNPDWGIPANTLISTVCRSSCATCSATAANAACTTSTAANRVDDVMAACCPSGGGHRRSQSGQCDLPEACPSEACALTFISFMDDCQSWLDSQGGALPMASFYRFKDRCQTLNDEQEGRGIVSCTASLGGVAIVPPSTAVSDGWIWGNLPCAPLMEAGDRYGMTSPPPEVQCTLNYIANPSVVYGYRGPRSAAECAHVLCHFSGGSYIFDSASWDGQVIATASPAVDQSETVITSDPNLFCVSCTSSTVGGQTAWNWDNLPCEPGMDYEQGRYDADPNGNERCLCHSDTDGVMHAFDGPASPAQCGHLICSNDNDMYTFDYCSWDGRIISEGSAGYEGSMVVTS